MKKGVATINSKVIYYVVEKSIYEGNSTVTFPARCDFQKEPTAVNWPALMIPGDTETPVGIM